MHRAIGLLAIALAVAPIAVRADVVDDLRDTVRQQGAVIQELRQELSRVKAEQARDRDRMQALEDRAAATGGSGGVTPEFVDRRIEAFQTSDESRFFLSGYGQFDYMDVLDRRDEEDAASTFNMRFNPIFHFRLTEQLHFNAELEIGLGREAEREDPLDPDSPLVFMDTETEVELEFATIDYLVNDWLTLSAGKFLMPFNVFGPKLHPGWINKMASGPIIYGGHHGVSSGIIPVISDVGVMASGGTELWNEDAKLNYAVYVTNGPFAEEDAPELSFENTPDDNNNKAVGGRVGFLPVPNLEIGASWMTGETRRTFGEGDPDEAGPGRGFDLFGADFWWWRDGLELRGEFVRLERDGGKDLARWGYWVQAAYRLKYHVNETTGWQGVVGRLEPVVRWGENNGHEPDNREQLAVGLNYWLYESVPLKFTYEFNQGAVKNDRLFFQLAYGF